MLTMKIKLFLILTLYSFLIKCQSDTTFWEYSGDLTCKQKFSDGYHILKKHGLIRQEFKIHDGKLDGLFKDYYDNGNLKCVANLKIICLNYFSYCGTYQEYYESGKIKTEGNYLFVDSIECQSCFDHFENKQNKIVRNEFVRTGLWKTFYENGYQESKGVYKGIHKIYYIDCDYPANKKDPPSIFCAGGDSSEFLKNGEWEFYSNKGNLIKLEYYFNGILAEVKTYQD
jgi:antitoxin component YwqK of YwqJK toxin-antitoxin module